MQVWVNTKNFFQLWLLSNINYLGKALKRLNLCFPNVLYSLRMLQTTFFILRSCFSCLTSLIFMCWVECEKHFIIFIKMNVFRSFLLEKWFLFRTTNCFYNQNHVEIKITIWIICLLFFLRNIHDVEPSKINSIIFLSLI